MACGCRIQSAILDPELTLPAGQICAGCQADAMKPTYPPLHAQRGPGFQAYSPAAPVMVFPQRMAFAQSNYQGIAPMNRSNIAPMSHNFQGNMFPVGLGPGCVRPGARAVRPAGQATVSIDGGTLLAAAAIAGVAWFLFKKR